MSNVFQQERNDRKRRVLGGSFGLFYNWTRQGIFTKQEFEEIIREVVKNQVEEELETIRSRYGALESSVIASELLRTSGE